MIGLKKIAPHQTVQIDVKKLRDNQTPDARGVIIPANIDYGQIKWTIRSEKYLPEQPLQKFELTGRSEQIDTIKGISSSYACHNCCQKAATGWIDAGGVDEVEIGDHILFTAWEEGRDCYGWYYPAYEVPPNEVDWNTSDDDVAVVDNGLVTVVGIGEFEIDGRWWRDVTTDYGGWCPDMLTVKSETEPKSEILGQNFVPDCSWCQTGDIRIGSDVEITAKPKVTIAQFKAVGKGLERAIQITNSSNATVDLTITTREGTGSATFSNGSTTMTISNTQNVTVTGVTESSKKDNIRLKATWTDNNRTHTLDEEDFCVLWATLALRTGGAITMDNAAQSTFNLSQGTTNLGTFQSSGQDARLWRTAVEIVGTVAPSDFDGSVVLARMITGKMQFHDRTAVVVPINNPDTSNPVFRDDNPQSGGSGGKVYDLDAPGIGTHQTRPIGFILRDRTNFRQYATFTESGQEMQISIDLDWFSRVSIQKQRRGDILYSDVNNDNTAGTGATPLTWDLTPFAPFAEGNNNMKLTMPLIAALTLTPLCEYPTFVHSQTKPKDCITVPKDSAKKDEVEKLLTVIRDKNLIQSEPAKVIAAIDKLRELKAEAAVDDLAQLLTLVRGEEYLNNENPPSGGIITKLQIYPAVGALFKIGQPAVPALLKVIETEESNSVANENALYVLTMLHAENLEKAVELLKKKITTAVDGEGAKRLLNAAKKIEDLIEKPRNPLVKGISA